MKQTKANTPREKGDLPHALTFFLAANERAAVLRALKRRDPDRSRALLRALRIDIDKIGSER